MRKCSEVNDVVGLAEGIGDRFFEGTTRLGSLGHGIEVLLLSSSTRRRSMHAEKRQEIKASRRGFIERMAGKSYKALAKYQSPS